MLKRICLQLGSYQKNIRDKHDGRKRISQATFIYEHPNGNGRIYHKTFTAPANTDVLKFFGIAPLDIDENDSGLVY
jgi:hypothetical protein